MKRKVPNGFILLVASILLLFAAMSVAVAHPVPFPQTNQTFEPVPEPIPAPSANGFSEVFEQEKGFPFGGMDAKDSMIAVGNTGTDTGIHFYNGDEWHGIDMDFIPTGIEWSGDDSTVIFVTDNKSNKVIKGENLSPNNTVWKEIGGPGSEPGQFNDPHGMFSPNSNSLYVVDTGNNRIQLWNGLEWVEVESPRYSEYMVDICIAGNTTYISDNSRSCIYYKTPEETGWNIIVSPTYINYPSYMDIDENGNIYFLSWVIYPDGPRKNVVRFSDGIFSVFVQSGNGPGLLNNEPTSEELSITDYGGLLYSDSTSGKIYRELCGINTLETITVNGIQIPLNTTDTDYEFMLEHTVEECLLEAFASCRYGHAEGTGVMQLEYGSNIFVITCYSEAGLPREYNFDIIRDISGNSQLSAILLDGEPLSGFNPETIEYKDISCPAGKETLLIEATALNPESMVLGTGTIQLKNGETPVLLTVIAPDGIHIQYYLLNLTKEEASAEPSPASSPSPTAAVPQTPSPSPSPSQSPELTPASNEPQWVLEVETKDSSGEINIDDSDADQDEISDGIDGKADGNKENWDFGNPPFIVGIILGTAFIGVFINALINRKNKKKKSKMDENEDS